ncbi:hypothetical protein [Stappia sp. ES.058]|uniref:hypothetical protein n=1 Tax=Stappia sp. ES.058 TaxID=1881061 RepID=UPI00087DAFA9|nr:hypothetical protein [Stappia sp. ES.058]SDT94194.1 hypothetical protein SAMN05428979_0590 [Stappia sp. ES.058]
MRQLATALAAAGLAVSLVTGAAAQSADAGTGPRPSASEDRYLLAPAGEAFLRLDRESGRVAECRRRGETWRCVAVPDAQLAMEQEISRLSDELVDLRRKNAALEKRLAATGRTSPPGGSETPDLETGDENAPAFSPEEEAELDKALDFTEKAMRRFFGLMKTLREEYDGMAN